MSAVMPQSLHLPTVTSVFLQADTRIQAVYSQATVSTAAWIHHSLYKPTQEYQLSAVKPQSPQLPKFTS